jgi:hypothetical protein
LQESNILGVLLGDWLPWPVMRPSRAISTAVSCVADGASPHEQHAGELDPPPPPTRDASSALCSTLGTSSCCRLPSSSSEAAAATGVVSIVVEAVASIVNRKWPSFATTVCVAMPQTGAGRAPSHCMGPDNRATMGLAKREWTSLGRMIESEWLLTPPLATTARDGRAPSSPCHTGGWTFMAVSVTPLIS